MQKNNKLKGRVKLVTINEQDLKSGNRYIIVTDKYTYQVILSIATGYITYENGSTTQITYDEDKIYSSIDDFKSPLKFKTLIIEYENDYREVWIDSNATAFPNYEQLPIKQSQWGKVLENNEIDTEVSFIIEDNKALFGTREWFGEKRVAKIIPNKNDKTSDEAKERYNRAMNELNLYYGHSTDRQFLDYLKEINLSMSDIKRFFKIAAGIVDIKIEKSKVKLTFENIKAIQSKGRHIRD